MLYLRISISKFIKFGQILFQVTDEQKQANPCWSTRTVSA